MSRVDEAVLRRPGLRLSVRRRLAGLGLGLLGPPLVTLALVGSAPRLSLGAVLLVYLLLVVLVAAVGGLEPSLLAALAGFLLANWYFAKPAHTLAVTDRDAVVELVAFVVVAAVVSLTVHLAAREQARATRSALETRLVARISAEPVGEKNLTAVLGDVGRVLGLPAVALVRTGGAVVELVGERAGEEPSLRVPAGEGLELVGYGPEPFGADRRVVASLAGAAARAHEAGELARQAARARELAEADKVRTGLLAAVGHDLRSPLAAIKAAVSSLRADDVDWSPDERGELLATIEDGTDRLSALVANLLDLSRLQAGSMPVHLVPVGLDEAVAAALLHMPHAPVRADLRDDLPLVLADPGLAERVVANLVDNACRYAPVGTVVEVGAHTDADGVRLEVIDHGPGAPPTQWDRMFVPFQRLDDRTSTGGLGLGLAIAAGFTEAMGGTLTPGTTPGGGMTMTVRLPCAAPTGAGATAGAGPRPPERA